MPGGSAPVSPFRSTNCGESESLIPPGERCAGYSLPPAVVIPSASRKALIRTPGNSDCASQAWLIDLEMAWFGSLLANVEDTSNSVKAGYGKLVAFPFRAGVRRKRQSYEPCSRGCICHRRLAREVHFHSWPVVLITFRTITIHSDQVLELFEVARVGNS